MATEHGTMPTTSPAMAEGRSGARQNAMDSEPNASDVGMSVERANTPATKVHVANAPSTASDTTPMATERRNTRDTSAGASAARLVRLHIRLRITAMTMKAPSHA